MPYLTLDPTTAQEAPATTLGDPLAEGGLTLEQMRNELRAQMLGRTDVTPERLDLQINFAYVDLATSVRMEELKGSIAITATAGQHLYKLPSIVYSTLGVAMSLPEGSFYEPGYPLDKTSLELYRSRHIRDDWPKEYFRHLGMLVVWPTVEEAGGTIVVDFRIRPKFLTENEHVPILGSEWHEAIVLLARQKTHSSLQEWELAGLAENEYIKWMRKRIEAATMEEDTRVTRSSVPRSEAMLRRPRRSGGYWDAVD